VEKALEKVERSYTTKLDVKL